MDVLADVLAATRIGNTVMCRATFGPPWGVRFDLEPRTHFHLVSRGSCWLRLGNQAPPLQLLQGDVALVPFGGGHVLSDSADTEPLPLSEALACQVVSPGQLDPARNDATALICGGYFFENEGKHPLLSLLPDVIHIPADQTEGTEPLAAILRLITREVGHRNLGADTVVSRLVDVLFVYILRSWLGQKPETPVGWLSALEDPQVGQALSLMHQDPGRRWTVASLASEVLVSRAVFAKRFTELVGDPPLAYLTRWRMDIAARKLRESDHVVWAIAQEVGYESEASFGKAFRRNKGLSPGQYRSRHRGL